MCSGPRPRKGFTLVEMLVVVVIIGVLAGLITGAAVVVNRAAKRAVVAAEINNLEKALHAYKEKFGDYPPDGTDSTLTKMHLAKAFPYAVNLTPPAIDPSTALCFWLGGMRDTQGNFIGFSPDQRNPFETATITGRIGPFFDFDKRRVQAVGQLFRYLPPNGNLQSDPYIYFRARLNNQYVGQWTGGGATIRPYQDAVAGGFVNPKTFQILSPGLDGKYWNGQSPQPGVRFPTGDDYNPAQYDDITNFSGGRTLEQNMP